MIWAFELFDIRFDGFYGFYSAFRRQHCSVSCGRVAEQFLLVYAEQLSRIDHSGEEVDCWLLLVDLGLPGLLHRQIL